MGFLAALEGLIMVYWIRLKLYQVGPPRDRHSACPARGATAERSLTGPVLAVLLGSRARVGLQRQGRPGSSEGAEAQSRWKALRGVDRGGEEGNAGEIEALEPTETKCMTCSMTLARTVLSTAMISLVPTWGYASAATWYTSFLPDTLPS